MTAAHSGRGEALQNRRALQKRLDVGGLTAEHLVDQIVHQKTVTARKGLDEPFLVGPLGQRQRGQLQGGDPALGLGLQAGNGRLGQVQPLTAVQKLRHLGEVEAQVAAAHFQQLAANTQP